jgi:drug/metabolite transporter (DMT)-like permease
MAFFWGASWPIGRALALALPPLSSSVVRFVIASTVLTVWVGCTRGWPRLSVKQWGGLTLAGSIGVSAYAVCYMLAMQTVEASRGAMVVATNPVFTTLLAAWLFKERFNAWIAAGLLVAVLGGMTVLSNGAPWTMFAGQMSRGEWLLLGCIAAWVTYTLLSRALMAGIEPLTASALSTLVGTVVMGAIALVFEGPQVLMQTVTQMDATLWALTFILAVGAGGLAYAWYAQGIAALGAGTAAGYICLVPIFGVALSAWTLGERLDAWLWIGGAMAVLGLALNHWGRVVRTMSP